MTKLIFNGWMPHNKANCLIDKKVTQRIDIEAVSFGLTIFKCVTPYNKLIILEDVKKHTFRDAVLPGRAESRFGIPRYRKTLLSVPPMQYALPCRNALCEWAVRASPQPLPFLPLSESLYRRKVHTTTHLLKMTVD